jgi:hypothetical protein
MRKISGGVGCLIMILLISLFLINGCEEKCKTDSDCVFDDCCSPTRCVLNNETMPDCESILICEVTPPAVSCICVEGECIMVEEQIE